MSSSAQRGTGSLLHGAQLCASRTEARTFRGRRVLCVKQKGSGARDYERVFPPRTPTTTILASASLPARLGGFGRHWKRAGLIHAADKSGACGLRRRVFLYVQTHACVRACVHACVRACIGGCVRLQTAPPLISSQQENDLDSAGCWMCLHTRNTNDIVSRRGALAATRRDAPTVTEAPIHLPLGWNTPQSLRSPAVLWLHP